ncbi:hypothetical protein MF271_16605 [Deinococcus sp. KNUC1210]|uniref:hypothetical protein n=1 Tax=Deinococcus sp. KNUC1210 TaxID=2917691 RepID=UPI001EF071D7|nr:hypothetical protein [Deinococcus sp. KNUC1210]ULH15512.1 hypothetical protein MF271_16605 [Deinococcus sp. KNUC1210]
MRSSRSPLLALLTVPLLLLSCGAGGSLPPSALPPTSVPAPLLPDPAYTAAVSAQDPFLPGTDHDRNGLRDDLDALVASLPQDRRALASAVLRAFGARAGGTPEDGTTLPAVAAYRAARADTADAELLALRRAAVNTAGRLQAYAHLQSRANAGFVAVSPGAVVSLSVGTQSLRPAIVFMNGIFTDEQRALGNVDALRALLGDAAGDYYLDYNPTDGLQDLMEVFQQKQSEGGFAAFVLGGLQSVGTADVATLVPQAAAIVQAGVSSLAALKPGAPSVDARVSLLADRLAPMLQSGRRVLLVPHSQGNLYANAVYAELQRRGVSLSNLRVVGAAVPNLTLVGGNSYVTSGSDNVINGLRLLFPVAPWNDTSLPLWQTRDPLLGHDFNTVYANLEEPISGVLRAKLQAALR